jgi:hypothetical protein
MLMGPYLESVRAWRSAGAPKATSVIFVSVGSQKRQDGNKNPDPPLLPGGSILFLILFRFLTLARRS